MDRRSLLKAAARGMQGVVALVLAIPAVRFLLGPLRRSEGEADYTRVAPLSAVTPDRPVRANVIAERTDAFLRYPPSAIGSVWLVRTTEEGTAGESGDPPVRCFQTICPHLGCAIGLAPSSQRFRCPCHASDFDLSGHALSGPSPRDMDELACRVTEPDDDGARWVEVRYARFRTGTSEKQRIT